MSAQINLFDESIVDNFAGGGGASTGIELGTGRIVNIAINHDPDAILMHQTNHPYTTHYQASVWDVDPVEYYSTGRPLPLTEPMHTVTAHDREALSMAHIVEFKGQDIGQSPERPLRTITASAGEFAVAKTVLVKADGRDLMNWPKIRELLNKYCGYSLAEDDVLLLQIGRLYYFIADITLRMLTPRELYNAMGFPPDYIIDRDYTGREYGKTKQVARCGNAVCPPMATALVQANFPEWCILDITTMAQLERVVAV